jgi:serine/threonine-protein kinase
MSTGNGGKPPTGNAGGRPPADTPRLVVRSRDPAAGEGGSMSDTAVASSSSNALAVATDRTSATDLGAAASGGSDPRPNLIGATLSGRYLITRQVGQGGMGAVYEATHTLLGKKIAVKVLLEKYAKRDAIVARLEQEARLATSINHEHIIEMFDVGRTDDGRTFVVMEFLDGESMAELLAREGTLPEQRLLRIAHQAASALAAAHAKGIVHRDIKPENVFLLRRKEQDFVKVVDFGISKSLRASDAEEEAPRLTQTGMVLGTPLYMSPEQARGDDDLDPRVDVYALGVILYEAATGRVPFSGTNYLSVISQVLNEEPARPRQLRPELSEEFEAIVLHAMAKDRKERYPSADAMLVDIASLLDDPSRSTERRRILPPRRKVERKGGLRILAWVVGIAVVIAAVALTVMATMGNAPRKVAAAIPPLPAPPADAAPPPPPLDAAVAPEPATIELQIESTPSGAQVYRDNVEQGPTPCKVAFVLESKDVTLLAKFPGYNDTEFKLNPLLYRNRTGEPVKIVLNRPKQGPPVKIPVKKPPQGKDGATDGAGSAAATAARPDGLHNPYQGSGAGSGQK